MAPPASDGRAPRLPTASGGEEWDRLHVAEVGRCLLVSAGRASRRGSMVARTLPAEDGRVAVLGPDALTTRVAELAERLWRWVPAVWESVRLVVTDAAVPDVRGQSPAQQLSEMLGVEVIAPRGRLLAVPDGSLFVTGEGHDAGDRAWWRFRPGRPAEPTGRRFPVPEWEPDLAGFVDPGIAGLDVEEVPAGLWVHRAGVTSPTDLAFAVPAHRESMALLVSRAGDPPLRNADIRRLLQALPVALWDWLTIVPYGDEPVAGTRLGAVVSVATNRVVPARTGLPLCRPDGGVQVVAVGRDGEPTWSPFAHAMAWSPHGGSRLLSWAAPAAQLMAVGPGQLQLTERWLVEVIEAGLWLREVDRYDGAAVVRRLPLLSRHCTIVVGGFGAGPRPPWRAVMKLVRQMPGAARARLRLAVPEAADERLVRAAANVCRRKLRGQPVYLLTTDGELVRRTVGSRPLPRRPDREARPPEPELGRPLPAGYRDPAPVRPGGVRASGPAGYPPRDDTGASPTAPTHPPVPPQRPARTSSTSAPAGPPTASTSDDGTLSRRAEPADP